MPFDHTSAAYSHLNLRENPFGEMDKEERGKVAIVEVEKILPLLEQVPIAIQFLADHGRGKSTHLIALHQHFSEAPYTQLHPKDNIIIPKAPLQFIDSIENLSILKRLKTFWQSKQLVFTTHKDLSHECRLMGIPVQTIEVSISPSQLHRALNKRIAFFRSGPGPLPSIGLPATQRLLQKFGDNVRAIEHFLYNYFQNMEELKDVKL